ncbi:MAG: DUF6090 family protein [Flavobacteriaceae bacterium]|nr:DUF6090 family protein [Flavobacteriaceae bacterium]MDH3796651.1 DUF6090 family protein [Flavobacteriaceae bacterium]
MIKFFRKIRRRLISGSNFSKYFLYAIGEILLIVIGILIALQINNWNQRNVRDKKEIEILKLIRSDLMEGVSEFDRSIAQYTTAKNSMKVIIDHLESDGSYQDSLKFHFFNTMLYWGTSDLSNSSFETLKSVGVDLISNKDLRDKLIVVFDEYDSWIKGDENRYVDILIDAGRNVLNSRFNEYWAGERINDKYIGEMIPLDFESLKRDQEYLFFLKSLKNQMKWLIDEPIKSTKLEVVKLIDQIDAELSKLEGV